MLWNAGKGFGRYAFVAFLLWAHPEPSYLFFQTPPGSPLSVVPSRHAGGAHRKTLSTTWTSRNQRRGWEMNWSHADTATVSQRSLASCSALPLIILKVCVCLSILLAVVLLNQLPGLFESCCLKSQTAYKRQTPQLHNGHIMVPDSDSLPKVQERPVNGWLKSYLSLFLAL